MRASAASWLAMFAAVLTACSDDEPEVKQEPMTLEQTAACAATHGRMSVLLKEKANNTMAGEERKQAADQLMTMSVGYFKQAIALSSKEEAAKKMGEVTRAQGEVFRKDPAAFGDYLLAEAGKCKPLATAKSE